MIEEKYEISSKQVSHNKNIRDKHKIPKVIKQWLRNNTLFVFN